MSASPAPPSTPRTIEIAPRGFAAFVLAAGERMRLIDVEGQQVGDLIAVSDADPDERLSCLFSQVATGRWRLRTGDAYYSNRSRPMLEIVEDTVGMHQLGGFCTPESNEQRYGIAGTPSCYGNFLSAMQQLGPLGPDHIQPDMCTSLFMHVDYGQDGSMEIREPFSRAGDQITLRATMPLRIAISNCPQERNPCNAYNPTSLRVELLGAE